MSPKSFSQREALLIALFHEEARLNLGIEKLLKLHQKTQETSETFERLSVTIGGRQGDTFN